MLERLIKGGTAFGLPVSSLRTCASWLLWEGKTIWEVAGVIGADASTVERVYAHHRKIEQERKMA